MNGQRGWGLERSKAVRTDQGGVYIDGDGAVEAGAHVDGCSPHSWLLSCKVACDLTRLTSHHPTHIPVLPPPWRHTRQDEMTKDDWRLVIKLKKVFQIN